MLYATVGEVGVRGAGGGRLARDRGRRDALSCSVVWRAIKHCSGRAVLQLRPHNHAFRIAPRLKRGALCAIPSCSSVNELGFGMSCYAFKHPANHYLLLTRFTSSACQIPKILPAAIFPSTVYLFVSPFTSPCLLI